MQRILREKEIRHESYIQGIGRSLFLAVSGAYLSFYLGFLFLIIANTSLAVTFSIMHEEGKGRYKTLLMLGAKRSDIYASAMSQIRHYFLLVLGLTAVSSIFAIITLFFSMVRIPAGASFALVLGLSAGAFLLLILIEVIYIGAVKKAIKKQIAAI